MTIVGGKDKQGWIDEKHKRSSRRSGKETAVGCGSE